MTLDPVYQIGIAYVINNSYDDIITFRKLCDNLKKYKVTIEDWYIDFNRGIVITNRSILISGCNKKNIFKIIDSIPKEYIFMDIKYPCYLGYVVPYHFYSYLITKKLNDFDNEIREYIYYLTS